MAKTRKVIPEKEIPESIKFFGGIAEHHKSSDFINGIYVTIFILIGISSFIASYYVFKKLK